MGVNDLTIFDMAAIYAMFLVPLIIMAKLGLGLTKKTLMAITRMSAQLLLMGIYLKYIFELNSLFLNVAWMTVMLLAANHTLLGQAGLSRRHFFVVIMLGTATASIVVTLLFVMVIIAPSPIYDARYLIPVFGMILGNCMRGNVVSLERFYSDIRGNKKELMTYLAMGATLSEAVRPAMKRAMLAAAGPNIAGMATIGLVSLPGMMTGQILGGSPPMTAVKYQIAIMVGIITAFVLGTALNIIFSRTIAFDEWGMPRDEVFD